MTTIDDIYDEQERAKAKHGASYMGSLRSIYIYDILHNTMTACLKAALVFARLICDGEHPTRIAVLVEEVCELAEYLEDDGAPQEANDELVQVAAMALAWLGVER